MDRAQPGREARRQGVADRLRLRLQGQLRRLGGHAPSHHPARGLPRVCPPGVIISVFTHKNDPWREVRSVGAYLASVPQERSSHISHERTTPGVKRILWGPNSSVSPRTVHLCSRTDKKQPLARPRFSGGSGASRRVSVPCEGSSLCPHKGRVRDVMFRICHPGGVAFVFTLDKAPCCDVVHFPTRDCACVHTSGRPMP
jgi:hypothetical protein